MPERTPQRATAAIDRRRPAPATIQRSTAPAERSPSRQLQERLGNHATQALISRAVAAPSKATRLPPNVSKPTDRSELEAEEAARKVMRMREPSTPTPPRTAAAAGTVQRAAASAPPI